jgi:copper(I)-binding protein
MRASRYLAGGVLLALIAVACTDGGDGIEIEDAWGRTAPSSAANAAFYMTINGGDTDDALVSAEADVCGLVELHETVMSNGVMKMQHLVGGIPIAAGSVVSLEPGGMHIMCVERAADIGSGETIPISLDFATGPTQVIEFEIRDQ